MRCIQPRRVARNPTPQPASNAATTPPSRRSSQPTQLVQLRAPARAKIYGLLITLRVTNSNDDYYNLSDQGGVAITART